ncbi:phage tail protein X [Sinobacterium caligoides]|uniref:Phage tail protein X n=1 Tax=Sinobacterium caligoides TaxID=933926 RepID=A0A3N2E0V9_9GAMM|nr:tail protein X [Sinobacterium caligoides]ROS05667.1 phage tail protein X [Sinobacterium caligoides]
MTKTYQTLQGDMLDEICWKHYVMDAASASAALVMDPDLIGSPLLRQILSQQSINGSDISTIVSRVIDENTHLLQYDVVLPAGINIILPDVQQVAVEPVVTLWD